MARIILISNTGFSVINFRSELVVSLSAQGHEVLVLCEANRYKAELNNLGVKWKHISYPKNTLSMFHFLKYFFKVVFSIREFKPDIVLTFTIIPNVAACLISNVGSFKLICNVTGFGRIYGQNKNLLHLIYVIYLKLLNFANVVFVQNKRDYGIVTRNRSAKTEILPGSGVNLERFDASLRIPVRPTILFIGRITPEKGAHHLIALAKLFPQYIFKFVGYPEFSDPSLIAEIAKLCDECTNVTFLPGTKDPYSEMVFADVICLPTSYAEGTPKSLIEALALGKMIIATNVPGVADCVDSGVNGFLLDPDNIHAELQSIFVNLSSFLEKDHKLVYKRSREISKLYSLDNVIERYTQQIDLLLKNM